MESSRRHALVGFGLPLEERIHRGLANTLAQRGIPRLYLTVPETKKALSSVDDNALNLAPRPGLEPGTCGLTVRRSTD